MWKTAFKKFTQSTLGCFVPNIHIFDFEFIILPQLSNDLLQYRLIPILSPLMHSKCSLFHNQYDVKVKSISYVCVLDWSSTRKRILVQSVTLSCFFIATLKYYTFFVFVCCFWTKCFFVPKDIHYVKSVLTGSFLVCIFPHSRWIRRLIQ